ncbi:ABC transporter substrate-binding protein, partial [Iamia sp.]|uniref:ABC transporter substrate-binding protein n=1 Tax=Iamia sp. TaxID=2722710 RepID=UPI002CCE9BB7
VRGGSVTYGLEAETGDGWCLPESQLAISGILVARAIFDTLTAPNADGEYVPYLAESVEPNEAFDEWTITLRDGVTFHDGSELTAEVVKNNIDAYRGQYEGRAALLFIFVLDNIDTVEVTDDLEVTVTTKVPWVSFPAFLHSSGRLGMIAQAQLDDAESCDRELIGTGPFEFESWDPGREFVATANEDYWQEAPDGEPYPYLEEIRFVPIVESEQRVNALESGEIDLMHSSGAQDAITLDGLEEDGVVKNRSSEQFAEVSFVQINSSKAPLDDVRVRRALALANDRADYKEVINRGRFTMASGPFAEGSPAYLEDAGYPSEQDLEEAEALIAEYEEEVGPLRTMTYQATPGAANQEVAVYIQQTLQEVGIDIEIETVQQDKLIDNAISGDYDLMGFRNYPGGDPDELYVWFNSTSPVNFGRIKDPEIDRLLEEGRSEPDPDTREQIYQDLNRQFGEQVWSIWAHWTTWRISTQPEVFGYTPETLPALPDGSDPFEGLATGHPLHGLWVDE